MANSWGESGTTWGQGNWGEQNNYTVYPSGLSIVSALNTDFPAFSEQGWGRDDWGSEPWGDSYDPVIALTGFALTTALGTFPYAQSEEGWGRDEWGYGNWGQNTTTVADITGFEMTGHMGPDGWGKIEWGESSWGGQPYVMNNLVPDVVGISGQSMTGSLGSPTINYDFIFALTNSFLGTVARGTLSINNGADHTQGLGGQAITGSLGSFPAGAPADVVQGLTALTGTMALGTAVTGELQKVAISGFGATASLGTLPALDYITVGLSGIAITGSNGTISPTSMSIGLTGYLITGSLGSSGVSPLGYKDIDITGNTSYTDVNVA